MMMRWWTRKKGTQIEKAKSRSNPGGTPFPSDADSSFIRKSVSRQIGFTANKLERQARLHNGTTREKPFAGFHLKE